MHVDTIYKVYLLLKVLNILGPVNPYENLIARSLFPEKVFMHPISADNFWRLLNPRSPSKI